MDFCCCWRVLYATDIMPLEQSKIQSQKFVKVGQIPEKKIFLNNNLNVFFQKISKSKS